MIDTQTDFLALLERLRGVTPISLDCEFQSEGRYYARLCLVQLAGGDELVAIDPFAVDLTPLGELLADESVLKLFHSAENDVPLLARATGQTVRNVFDTQVAAPFVGLRPAPAYSMLVERFCGVRLSKRARFTDWVARPLSREQVAYALDDVRYLPELAAALHAELVRYGRFEWAAMATEEMLAKAHAPRDRSRLYLRLKPSRDMTRRQLAVLREVAAWRDRRAAEVDRPPGRIAADEALLQLAYKPPRTADEVARLRGLQGLGGAVSGLLAAVKRAMELPEGDWPPPLEPFERDERAELVNQLLATALRVRANELEIAPSVIATRDGLESVVAWHFAGREGRRPEVVSPEGWKGEAVGEVLLGVLEGRYALRVDPEAPDGVVLMTLAAGEPPPNS